MQRKVHMVKRVSENKETIEETINKALQVSQIWIQIFCLYLLHYVCLFHTSFTHVRNIQVTQLFKQMFEEIEINNERSKKVSWYMVSTGRSSCLDRCSKYLYLILIFICVYTICIFIYARMSFFAESINTVIPSLYFQRFASSSF